MDIRDNKYGDFRKTRFRNNDHRNVSEKRQEMDEEDGVYLTGDYDKTTGGMYPYGGIRAFRMWKY